MGPTHPSFSLLGEGRGLKREESLGPPFVPSSSVSFREHYLPETGFPRYRGRLLFGFRANRPVQKAKIVHLAHVLTFARLHYIVVEPQPAREAGERGSWLWQRQEFRRRAWTIRMRPEISERARCKSLPSLTLKLRESFCSQGGSGPSTSSPLRRQIAAKCATPGTWFRVR